MPHLYQSGGHAKTIDVPPVTGHVVAAVERLRRRYVASRLTVVLATAVAIALTAWLLLGLVDYLGELPTAPRRWTLGIAAVALLAGLIHRVTASLRDGSMRSFTRRLESTFDGFGQRLRTVLDGAAGRITGPRAMLTSLGNQTLGRWETLSPERLIPRRGLIASSVSAVVAAGLIGGVWLSGPPWRTAMLRAAGLDRPYTRMTVAPGNRRVLEGDPVAVSLTLTGRTNRDVTLWYREASTEPGAEQTNWIETQLLPLSAPPRESSSGGVGASPGGAEHRGGPAPALPPPGLNPAAKHQKAPIDATGAGVWNTAAEDRAVFSMSLGKAAKPLEYRFVTSVGTTPLHRIDVQPLIEVERLKTSVQPPTYTRLPSRSFTTPDITALQGSTIRVDVHTNHPLASAVLEMGTDTRNLTAVEDAVRGGGQRWTFDIPADRTLRWRLTGRGPDGTPIQPVAGRVRIRHDERPTIAWQSPHDEVRVHTLAEVPMDVRVSDDYGVSQAAIVFQLGGNDQYVLTEWLTGDESDSDQDPGSGTTTRLSLAEILPLESFGLSERDYISYYAYAIDNRQGAGGDPRPQRAESDVRYLDIRPLRQFFGEIELEPGQDGGGQIVVQLDEIIRRQRFLINRTRRLVRGETDVASQIGAIDRMVEGQSELAGLTRFLSDFLVSRGNDDVEALSQAEAAMLQAADSLAIGSFELTLVQQDDAQRALAEARRTLEIFLIKNPTPAQRRAMRAFARQMRQKLRREFDQTPQQIADSLRQIAAQQRQLSQKLASAGSPPPPEAESGSGGGGMSPPTKPESQSPSGEDLFAEQLDLLERLRSVGDSMAEDPLTSELLKARLADATEQMDQIALQAREATDPKTATQSDAVADLVDEMSVQADAVAQTEAVGRVASLGDLLKSLAALESRLGGGQSDPQSTSPAKRLGMRAQTVQDVLAAPVEIGDVEASEVQQTLLDFAEEQELPQRLAESRAAAQSPTPAGDDGKANAESTRRAIDYATAAARLQELYRQRVAPRLANLRKLEQRASQLAQQLGGGGESKEDPQNEAALGQLTQDLKDQGLRELAEVLGQTDGRGNGPRLGTSTQVDASLSADAPGVGGVVLVVEELRRRIREMILLEIAADRDSPVPPQYRAAVDGYFRDIAAQTSAAAPGGSL